MTEDPAPHVPDDEERREAERMSAETGWPVELLLARIEFTPKPSRAPDCPPRPHLPIECPSDDMRDEHDPRHEPVDVGLDELLDAAAVEPHEATRTEYPWGVAWTCTCGRWEAVATGLSSAGFAERDYRRHVRDEEAATGGE